MEPFDYESLKETLEKAIKSAEHKKRDIELDENFFGILECEIKNRVVQAIKDPDDKDEPIGEEDSRFENLEKEKIKTFKFCSCYDQHSTYSLTTTKGWSVGVGGNLGAGAMGATAGVDATAQYGRSKSSTGGGSHGETKTLELSGEVEPGHVVTVKELAYRETTYRFCDMKLSANKNSDVPYYFKGKKGKEHEKIKMYKLIKHLSKTHKEFRSEGDHVTFHLNGRCKFTCVIHTLRSSQAKIASPRLQRIKLPEVDRFRSERSCGEISKLLTSFVAPSYRHSTTHFTTDV